MACVRHETKSTASTNNPMPSLDAILGHRFPQQKKRYYDEIIFPPRMYGEWRRVQFAVTGKNNQFISTSNARNLTISFHRTLNDFVRATQENKMKRTVTTWFTDGVWHDNERITIHSETKLTREVRRKHNFLQETIQLNGDYLHLIGYNGRFWYRAIFRKDFYPMKPIPEISNIF